MPWGVGEWCRCPARLPVAPLPLPPPNPWPYVPDPVTALPPCWAPGSIVVFPLFRPYSSIAPPPIASHAPAGSGPIFLPSTASAPIIAAS